jgi:hypothetical protein
MTNSSAQDASVIWLFIGLHVFGCVGITAILCTVLASRNIYRYPTWINLAISWIFSSFSYNLLLITGQQSKEVPDYGLCLTQATLIYATPVLCVFTTLALVIQIWQHSSTLCGVECFKLSPTFLLVMPYALALLVVAEVILMGIEMPWNVQKEFGLYCGIINGIPGKVSSGLAMLAIIVSFIIEGRTVFLLCHNRRILRGIASTCSSNFSIGMVVRVALFSIGGVFVIIIASIFILNVNDAQNAANISLASMPALFVVVFGTQEDILKVWIFWRKDTTESQMLGPKDLKIINDA